MFAAADVVAVTVLGVGAGPVVGGGADADAEALGLGLSGGCSHTSALRPDTIVSEVS